MTRTKLFYDVWHDPTTDRYRCLVETASGDPLYSDAFATRDEAKVAAAAAMNRILRPDSDGAQQEES